MKESLTNRQITFIIFGILVGYGVISLPKDVVENAGTGGWFSLLIGTVIAIIFVNIFTYLGYINENKTIYEYSQRLIGKFLTYILMIVIIIYFFFIFTMVTRLTAETIKLTILLKTPIWILVAFLLLAVFYSVTKTLRVIARICEIYGVIIIIAATFIHLAMFSQGNLINLRPFFEVDEIPTYIKATKATIFPFLGIEILMIVPFNSKENNKKIFKYITLTIVFIGLFYITEVESCISIMGVDSIINYKDALFGTIRRIEIPNLQFLRRLDGVILIIWIMSVFCTVTLFAYGTVFLINKLFNNIPFNLLSLIVIFISFLVALIPTTINETQKILEFLSYYGLFIAGVLPLILLIMTKVKKHDKKVD